MLPKDTSPKFFFFALFFVAGVVVVLGGVLFGVAILPPNICTRDLLFGLGDVRLMAGEGEGESIDDTDDLTPDFGVAIALSVPGVRRGGVMDITRGRAGDKCSEAFELILTGDSRTDLINFGEYIDVVRVTVGTEPVGALICLADFKGVEFAGSSRGKLWTGAESRRDATEGVVVLEFGKRLDVADGGGRILAGVFRPDRTVVLPLASEAMDDGRGFFGLSESSGLSDWEVEREIREEDSEGATEDRAGIVDLGLLHCQKAI